MRGPWLLDSVILNHHEGTRRVWRSNDQSNTSNLPSLSNHQFSNTSSTHSFGPSLLSSFFFSTYYCQGTQNNPCWMHFLLVHYDSSSCVHTFPSDRECIKCLSNPINLILSSFEGRSWLNRFACGLHYFFFLSLLLMFLRWCTLKVDGCRRFRSVW